MSEFTKNAQLALKIAEEVALGWNHEYYGTEHILAALVNPRLRESTAGDIFAHFEIEEGAIRQQVENVVQPGPPMIMSPGARLGKTPRVAAVLKYASEEAQARGTPNHINTGDLLIGLFRESEGVAAQILTKMFGLKVADVREFLAHRAHENESREQGSDLIQIRLQEGLYITGFDKTTNTAELLKGLEKIMDTELDVTGIILLGTKKD